jgi:hypothetical protein
MLRHTPSPALPGTLAVDHCEKPASQNNGTVHGADLAAAQESIVNSNAQETSTCAAAEPPAQAAQPTAEMSRFIANAVVPALAVQWQRDHGGSQGPTANSPDVRRS